MNPKALDSYMDVVNDQSSILLQHLDRIAAEGQYVNIISPLANFFLDTIARTHFGIETEEQRHCSSKLNENFTKGLEMIISARALNPFFYYNFIFYCTSTWKKIKKLKDHSERFTFEVIEERLKRMEKEINGESVPADRWPYYVDLVRDAHIELNIKPSVENIKTTANEILISATDTSSVALSCLLYHVALHPDIQEKLHQEALEIFGEERFKNLTWADLNRLTYLERCYKESLRLSSPPGILRDAVKDCDVGKYTIPKGTVIYLSLKTLHTDPLYWETPDKFNPDHFLPEVVAKRPKMAFLPFSYGNKDCPGRNYSLMTAKTAAALLFRNYTVQTNLPLEDIKHNMILMQEHVQGYPIKLTRRK